VKKAAWPRRRACCAGARGPRFHRHSWVAASAWLANGSPLGWGARRGLQPATAAAPAGAAAGSLALAREGRVVRGGPVGGSRRVLVCWPSPVPGGLVLSWAAPGRLRHDGSRLRVHLRAGMERGLDGRPTLRCALPIKLKQIKPIKSNQTRTPQRAALGRHWRAGAFHSGGLAPAPGRTAWRCCTSPAARAKAYKFRHQVSASSFGILQRERLRGVARAERCCLRCPGVVENEMHIMECPLL
jgi:hypothetical protein